MGRILTVLLMAAVLAACSGGEHTSTMWKDAGKAPASATTNALAGTPMAAYGHDLNKAKHVQDVVNAQASKQAKAIDDATGGGH